METTTGAERRAKHKHAEQLNAICIHGRDLLAANRVAQERVIRLGRSILAFHTTTDKEEQKCIERLAKERLRALKADDEEAYMKLIDTSKDTRITHLLRQTDSYLDSLAQAKQSEHGHIIVEHGFETEDGPASESIFGEQVNQVPGCYPLNNRLNGILEDEMVCDNSQPTSRW